jgi:hypothetical protein
MPLVGATRAQLSPHVLAFSRSSYLACVHTKSPLVAVRATQGSVGARHMHLDDLS